jgi:hypothetical protein
VEYCDHQDSHVYAHYTTIVQSSGMGKSRMVDELARNHFVIPINLRGPHSNGIVSPVFMLMYIAEPFNSLFMVSPR